MLKLKPLLQGAGVLLLSITAVIGVGAQEGETPQPAVRELSLKEFIGLATQQDTEFSEILVSELSLRYQEDLKLPARDLVLSVTEQMEFFFEQDREDPQTLVGLSKHFPLLGTELDAEYEVSPRSTSTDSSSSMSFTLAQDIAQNAFGHNTRLYKKIIGLETAVARYQIYEAYEDYLGTLMLAYLDWYEAYESLEIAKSSFLENQKLLNNMRDREKSNIALPIDVNKTTLQVLAKKEALVQQEQEYKNRLITISTAIRYTGEKALVPMAPELLEESLPEFDTLFGAFKQNSRTYAILNLLEEKSGIEVSREADELLPSIQLLVGYERIGVDYGIEAGEGMFFLGISGEWPLFDHVERAEHKIAQIEDTKTKLNVKNTHYRLYTLLHNLYQEIQRERRLAAIAKEKIDLSQAVLKDESQNYTYGKVTLNDYIQAVNGVDNNRFNMISHEVQLHKLLVDWQRLTDELVSEQAIREKSQRTQLFEN